MHISESQMTLYVGTALARNKIIQESKKTLKM